MKNSDMIIGNKEPIIKPRFNILLTKDVDLSMRPIKLGSLITQELEIFIRFPEKYLNRIYQFEQVQMKCW